MKRQLIVIDILDSNFSLLSSFPPPNHTVDLINHIFCFLGMEYAYTKYTSTEHKSFICRALGTLRTLISVKRGCYLWNRFSFILQK